MTLPIIEPTRLTQLATDATPAAIASLMHSWEWGFLSDVRYATEDPEGRKKARAYQVNDDLGGTCPFMVDFHTGGGHMLPSKTTEEFCRLKLIKFDALPFCDCGDFDDEDDWEWPSPPSQCTCCDQGIRLSDCGRAVLEAAERAAAPSTGHAGPPPPLRRGGSPTEAPEGGAT